METLTHTIKLFLRTKQTRETKLMSKCLKIQVAHKAHFILTQGKASCEVNWSIRFTDAIFCQLQVNSTDLLLNLGLVLFIFVHVKDHSWLTGRHFGCQNLIAESAVKRSMNNRTVPGQLCYSSTPSPDILCLFKPIYFQPVLRQSVFQFVANVADNFKRGIHWSYYTLKMGYKTLKWCLISWDTITRYLVKWGLSTL